MRDPSSEVWKGPGPRAVTRSDARRLLLFGKLPVVGRAKTRLAPRLGLAGAAELYEAFLEDTASTVRGVEDASGELWLEPGPAGPREPEAPSTGETDEREAGKRLARRLGLPVAWQAGDGLGERLHAAFARTFERDVNAVVVVGSDHPTLPVRRLERAFEALEVADVVLGPSEDGGYYAVGLRRAAWPRAGEIFRDVPWSTPYVLDRTRRSIDDLELEARELEPWYDVDEPRDLERLAAHLDPESRTAAALARLEGEAGPRPAGGGSDRPGGSG